MRFREYVNETTTTTSTRSATGPDAVTSNKLIRVELTDDNIKQIVSELEGMEGISVETENGISTINMPYSVPKKLMKKLSGYVV